jgi:hypothetical protein
MYGPAYRTAATMETSVNLFTKPGLFSCNRHIFQDHEFALHGMDESQGGAGNDISRTETSTASFHSASDGKFIIPADIRPIVLLTPKCFAPADEAKLSRASCAKLLTACPYKKDLWECQEKKALSLSKKLARKRLFGTRSKRSSKIGRTSIQE